MRANLGWPQAVGGTLSCLVLQVLVLFAVIFHSILFLHHDRDDDTALFDLVLIGGAFT